MDEHPINSKREKFLKFVSVYFITPFKSFRSKISFDFFKLKILIGGSIFIFVLSFLIYSYIAKISPNDNTQDVTTLIKSIGELTILPTGEEPTIATVMDISKLKEQPFFENALVGDRLIIYSESKRAILYRPSENKIIEIGPINR